MEIYLTQLTTWISKQELAGQMLSVSKNTTYEPSFVQENEAKQRQNGSSKADPSTSQNSLFSAFMDQTDQKPLWKGGPCIQKRLITIEHVWFPVAQTLIGKGGRQRGDTLKPGSKVSLLQSMT